MKEKKGFQNRRWRLALPLLALASAAQAAQEPLSLQEAIKLSWDHSTSVQIARKSYEITRARIGQQGARGLPQLAFTGSATEFDNRTTVSLPGSGAPFQIAPDHQESLALVLSQDFDIAGQIQASVSQARLEALSAKYDLQSSLEDQALATTTTYYVELRAEQNVRVASAALDAYNEQLKTATKLYQGGVGQKIDVDRAKSQVANAEGELVRDQNDRDSARSELNDLLGRPLDEPVQLVDPASHLVVPSEASQDRTQLIARALDRRPEALSASVQVAAAAKGIKIARASIEPDLSLALSGSHYPTTSFQYPRPEVGAVTLSLSIPLFDGGLARARVKEARSQVDIAKAQQDRTRRDISLQVQNAALAVETARKRLEAANVSLDAAQAARNLAEQRYQAQVSLYLEVTDAQSALTAAQSAQVDATYDLLTAQARLARSLSDPIVG